MNKTTPLQKKFLIDLFTELDVKGIPYAVLRNHENYPSLIHKPDIGLIIKPNTLQKILTIFKNLCTNLDCKATIKPNRTNIVSAYCYSGREDGKSLVFKVDVRLYKTFKLTKAMEKIPGFNYKVFFEEMDVTTTDINGIRMNTLAPVDEYLLMLKHWKRKNQKEQLDRLQLLAQNVDVQRALSIYPNHEDIIKNNQSEKFDLMVKTLVTLRWGNIISARYIIRQFRATFLLLSRSLH